MVDDLSRLEAAFDPLGTWTAVLKTIVRVVDVTFGQPISDYTKGSTKHIVRVLVKERGVGQYPNVTVLLEIAAVNID
ncbi:hypothetical protein [Natronobacterium gregoryi]|uniref:Uncharacterized protein n=2 Tax=Natronobacterium gregoryi TaxID=44930 RepID=L0AM50_NATGS|nr:hypothetical protein [Natronobacterium gregoryi]AFZ74100.1 hypothetical protein Natgr_2964 [Natronobacterium gregoryi SP2]ELY63836.1 hypothetical protein C490_14922 [Natronobacterium gregoryi SP2]PLK18723.1 hypothetical protein CYV19_17395 [Natronobacterium gregoryi SP2]SFJ67136.1 hypothetical protein SAMN05443661_15515 [Natronobacterium gregoryi]